MELHTREVLFRISENRADGKYHITVCPQLNGLCGSNGGEQILLAIAANCVRIIAQCDGLERAMERLTDMAISRTRVERS